jgi:hypothetical protein
MQKRILSFRPANFAKNVNEYDPTFDGVSGQVPAIGVQEHAYDHIIESGI